MKKVYTIACNIQAQVFFATRLGKGLPKLAMLVILFASQVVSAQNIFSGEGVNWVGQINGYSQPTNLAAGDYRVLQYRKVSTTATNPGDGRGQWATTINVQATGGNVTPLNMAGGNGNGFIFTSGPPAGQFNNKWNFAGVGSGSLNAVNGVQYVTTGGQDMGLNMSTAGHYTFVLKDAGYSSTGFYVGYTTNAPVNITHTPATQLAMQSDRSAVVSFTLSGTPSTQERFFVRYRTTTNDFSTTNTVVEASQVSGTTYAATIPAQAAGTNVFYYIFSSTMTLSAITTGNAADIAYEALRYADNSGNNYSYAANPIRVTSSTGTGAPSATYATLAAAITAINTGTAHTVTGGNITCFVPSGYTETAPAGGFSITATGTGSSNAIIFQKSGTGTNPTFTAPTTHNSGNLNDAIFKLIGADWVTINGFTMQENSLNTTTTAASNNMTEWGVALLYATTTNGAQNCTIQNNTITLNRTYQNTFGIYSNSTHSATAVTTTTASATTTAGGNSGLKIYGNTISNVNQGINVTGPTAAADLNTGLDIGGTSAGQGNSITNWGTTGSFSAYANVSGTLNGILVRNCAGYNISYNTVTSSAGGNTVTSSQRAIYVPSFSAAPTTAVTCTISNNSISVQSGITTGTVNGIIVESSTGSASSSLTISSNNFSSMGHTVASPTGAHTYISSSMAHLNTTINNNTFTNISATTTGSITFVSNAIAVPTSGGTQTISGNSIVTAFTKSGAGGTVTFFSSNASSVTGSIITFQNNNFSNITLTGATGFVGINNTDGGSPTKTITGNTFNNISGGTGTINPMTVNFFGGTTSSVSSNTITNISWGAAITALTIGSSSTATTLNVNSNIITNNSTTVGNNTGISNASASTTTNISLNTINNLTSTSTTATVVGITSSATTANIFQNTINTLTCVGTTSGVTNGIMVTGGTTATVNRNNIYDLSTTGAFNTTPGVNGILISGGTTVNCNNNLIGNLSAGASTSTDAIRGISITSTTTNSTYNIYYNTVNINASSTGANFGTTGIFHTASSTATTAVLNLRNNIIVNTSTPAGTGLTVAYRRSSGLASTLANYASTSNNNLFYAGAPGASNLIYSDGTSSAQTMSAYKSGVFTAGTIGSRDASSASEAITFQSTTGSSADFLKYDLSIATQAESGGAAISGFTTDFLGATRNVSTPDIGAWELNGVAADLTGPSISYTAIPNTLCTNAPTLSATITDASGVNISAGSAPRLYYKKSADDNTYTGNTSADNGWKFVESTSSSSPFSFTIDGSILQSAMAAGDVIQYFVVVQDNASSPNVGINSGTFTSAPASVALTSASFPLTGTINSYNIGNAIPTSVTIGATGTYASITGTGGLFAAINAGGLSGNTVANIIDASVTETGAVALNQISYGCTPNATLTIKPQTTATLTGSSTTALITLNGADFITIDGSNNGTTSRNLTITNTSTGTSSAVIWLQSSGTNGATSNNIINCNIVGNTPTTTLMGIGSGSSTISATSLGTNNNNNTFQNNNISKVQYAIYSQGNSAGTKNTGNLITQNLINTASPNQVSKSGILVGFENNITISNNNISNISGVSASYAWAINLGALTSITSTAPSTGNEVTNATISANVIGSIRAASTYGAGGIIISPSTSGINLIANNIIFDVAANGTFGDCGIGIMVAGGSGSTTRVYHNSVSMSATLTGGSGPNIALAVSDNPVIDIRNNILASTGSTGSGPNRSIALNNSTYTNLTSNYNNLFVSGGGTTAGVGATGGWAGTAQVALSNWQTTTSQDANSISSNPLFTSNTNLVPTNGTPLANAGTPIAGITTDYRGTTRNNTTPTIGAIEIENCTAPVAQPTSILFSAIGTGQMTISFTPVSVTGIRYLVVRYPNAATPTNPSNSTTYALGASLGSGTVVLSGSNTSRVVTGLAPNTTYDYYVYSFNDTICLNGPIYNTNSPLFGSQSTNPCPTLNATVTIGQTGADYSSLTDALLVLNGCGITQPTILELQPDYISTGEIFPLTLGNVSGANSTNTITIRPAATVATPLIITSNNATGTISHNQGSFFIIDGRPGGAGTSRMLNIENSSTSGYAVNYQNESSNNALRYLLIESANTGTTSGTIVFSNTTGTNGNDNNTIEYCNIFAFDPISFTPTNAIYAAGSTGTSAANNNANIISNNNIYDFYNNSVTTQICGINISGGNSDWNITNNSFYQTVNRTTFGTGVTLNAILINNSSGNNFVINDNFIGGSQPLCAGTPMTLNTTATLVFRAIQLSVGNSAATSLQNNTIRNISVTTASASTVQSAISLLTGSFNCGNITGNTIGSQSSAGSITFTQSTTSIAAIFSGILAGTGTPGAINISNNLIGGITVSNSSTGALNLRGISVQGASTSYTISNNTIGSTTVASSLSNSTNSSLFGIFSASTSLINNISANTIANLTNSSTGSSAQVVGLSLPGSSGGVFSATGNTVRNLNNSGANTGTASLTSVIGISLTAATNSGQLISQNTIFSLSNATAGSNVTGIHYNGPTTGTNEINSNLIHSLNAGSTVSGIEIADLGNALVYNNMVRLGIDASGNDITANLNINGIRQTNAASNHGIYFNSIYVGGAGILTGANNTFAIHSAATSGTRIIRNNIYTNLRTNGTGTGKHYSIRIASLTGLTINNNDYWTGSNFLALNNAADVTTLNGWQTATSQDAGSVSNDPNFINATGNTAALDLHINNSTSSVLESGGVNISGITTDRDGHTRPGPTGSTNGGAISSDIGADEFDGIPGYTCSTFPALTATTTNATVCNSAAALLQITGTISGTGITYQWQSATTQNGTYSNISGATGATYTVPSTSVSNLWYVCQVTCANGPTTATTASVNVQVQACNYTVTRNTAITYNSIMSTGSTYTSLSDADDGITNLINLPSTTFRYRGSLITGFIATSNGWMTFNTSNTSNQWTNNLGSTDFNVLAPFWDDLVIRGDDINNKDVSMRYQIIGTLGSGTADIVIEWAEMERFQYGDPNINFQVVLHEADNSIDFNYGNFQMFNGATNPSTQTWTYSVGMNGPTPATASTDQRIILQAENSTFFNATSQNSLGYSLQCNSQYRFVPSTSFNAGSAPTSGSFFGSTFAPANNEVAGSIGIAVNNAPCTSNCGNIYTSKNATATPGITACSAAITGNADDDVFFSFTTTSASNYRISVDPSAGYDAVVQLLDNSLTPVTCVNAAAAGLSELIASVALNPSSLYYLRIYDAAAGSTNNGEFALCVSEVIPPPANDNPSGAVVLTTGTTCTGTSSTLPATLSATATSGITACTAGTPGTPDDDIWYSFTTNSIAGTTYAISATGVSTYNAVLQLFSGTVGSLTSVNCVNATGNGGTETINAAALATNTTYYFRVYHSGVGAANGNVSVCVVHTLPTCLTSISATTGDYIWQGQSINFNTANNWLIYNGPSSYSVATAAPSAANIFIPSSTCFANQPAISSAPASVNNVSILSGATLDLGNNTLTVNGNLSSSGTLTTGTSTVILNGSSAQSITAGQAFYNLTIDNNLGVSLGQNITVTNNLTLTAGTLTVGARTLSINGSIIRSAGNIDASNASATVLFGGSAAQSIPASTFSGNINNLTVNNSAGLTSDQALTVNGTLTLTAGVLNMGANLLTIGSTNTSAVSRTSGYVSGPVALTLPANLASGSTYLFPLGKAAYTPFALVNPTTNAGGFVVIRAEVFDAATGGSAGAGLSSINTNRYWDVSISSGTSNFINTSVRATESAIGTLNRLANNATTLTGTYAAVSTGFPDGNSITSSTLTGLGYFVFAETVASLTEIYMPQFMQGKSGTNDNRIPHIFRATLTNLYPSTTYRYFNAAVTAADASSSNGAGNPIFINAGTSTLTRSTAPDLSSSFGSFTTDANGTYTGWFMLEPTGDARFDAANSVLMRIMLNDGNGGTTVSTRITSTNAAKVIDLNTGSGANDGTAVYGGSLTNEKNMVVLFDNVTGAGRPIAASVVESDGIANTAANGYASFYENNVNGTARRWGTIIPNANANGIKRIEYRNLSNGNMHYWVSDNDGNWDGSANTVNPTGGSTPLVIPSNISDDATFAPNTTTILLQDMNFNGKIDLATGSNIVINGFNLTLNDGIKIGSIGSFTGSGTSSIIIGGTGNGGSLIMDQTTTGVTNTLRRLVISKTTGTITLGNTLNIIDSVSVSNTGATLATGDNLVLISNATQTARVGRLGGSITGNVAVQRFIPAVTRRFRMVSPNTQNFAYSQLIDDIFVTGSGGVTNGFDASPNNGPTIYTYQESTTGGRGWKPVTNISSSLGAGQGAIVFVRGDRTLASPAWFTQGQFPAQNAVTLDFIQNINSGASGAISPALTYTNTSAPTEDGWNLVGNPYPSQIDWRLVSKNNLSTFYYAFNPATNAYVASDGDLNNSNNPFIASGQAFFVQAVAASPSISFDENCKSSATPTSYFKSAGSQITIEMIRDSINSDIAFMQIKPGANMSYSGAEDARKYPNPDINFGYQISGTPVQINRVPPLTNIADTFILFANAPQGTYRLQVGGLNNIPAFKAVLLRDLFTSQTTDLRSNGVYTFQITSNTSSSGNRFQLIIINQSALPVELISFTATRVNQTDDVSLNWLTANEKNNAAFVVERSFDGESFEGISTLKGAGNSNSLISYAYLDEAAVKEANNKQADVLYYRLRQLDFSGESQTSNVVSISLRDWYSLGKNKSGISLYPNPATTEVFVSMANNGNIKLLEIFDVAGKRVLSIQNPEQGKPIDLYGLKAGVYLVKVNAQETSKLIIE